MLRLVLGVIGGFFSWVIMWFGTEKILSAIFPVGFGAPQRAFQTAVENGGQFTAVNTMLFTHIGMGIVVSVLSGALAALIAGRNPRAALILGFLLLALGILKAVISWPYVPLWYHVIFTAMLFPLAILGGKLMSSN